jgi:hypothetical protein
MASDLHAIALGLVIAAQRRQIEAFQRTDVIDQNVISSRALAQTQFQERIRGAPAARDLVQRQCDGVPSVHAVLFAGPRSHRPPGRCGRPCFVARPIAPAQRPWPPLGAAQRCDNIPSTPRNLASPGAPWPARNTPTQRNRTGAARRAGVGLDGLSSRLYAALTKLEMIRATPPRPFLRAYPQRPFVKGILRLPCVLATLSLSVRRLWGELLCSSWNKQAECGAVARWRGEQSSF